MREGLFLAGRIFAMIVGEIASLYLLQHGQENWGEIVGGIVVLYGVLTGNFLRTWSLGLSVVSALAGLMFGLTLLKAQPDNYLLNAALFLFAFAMFIIRYMHRFEDLLRECFEERTGKIHVKSEFIRTKRPGKNLVLTFNLKPFLDNIFTLCLTVYNYFLFILYAKTRCCTRSRYASVVMPMWLCVWFPTMERPS